MATATPKTLYHGQPGTSSAKVYTAPAGGAMITGILMCNTTASSAKFRLHKVSSAGSAAVTNALFYDYGVAANDSADLETAIPLAAGEELHVSQTTSGAITLLITGPEVV